jgi:hypothetical protein
MRALSVLLAAFLVAAGQGQAADFAPWNEPAGMRVSFPYPIIGDDGLIIPYTASMPLKSPNRTYKVLRMEGPIEEGDAERLRAAAGETDPWGNTILYMNSDGGNFDAGIALGDAISELHIFTIVGPGDRCLSACAFAFLGGQAVIDEDGTTTPTRQVYTDAVLGFHAPSQPGSVSLAIASVPGASEVLAQEFARPTLANIAALQRRSALWLLSSDMLANIMAHVGQDDFITIDRAYEASQNEIYVIGPPLEPVTGWGAVEALQACSLIMGHMLWQERLDLPIPAFGGGFQGWMPGAPFFRTVLADRRLAITETPTGPIVTWSTETPKVGTVTCTVTQGSEGPQVMLYGEKLPGWTTVARTLEKNGPIPISRLGLLGYGVPWRAIGADDLYVEQSDLLWAGIPPDALADADASTYCTPDPVVWAPVCRFPTLHRAFAVMMALSDRLQARQRYYDVWTENIQTLCRPQALPKGDPTAEMFAGYCGLMVAQDLTRIALEKLPPQP